MDIKQYLTKRNIIIAAIVLFIILIIWSVVVLLTKKEDLNPGGTGGDYTPTNWVTLQGIDRDYYLSDNTVVGLRNTLQYYLQENQPKDGDYLVQANKSTLVSEFSPNVYRYTGFKVTVDNNTSYWLHTVSSLIIGTSNTLIADGNNIVTTNSVTYRGLDLLLQQGVIVDSVNSLKRGISEHAKPSKTVVIEDNNISVKVNSDGSRTASFITTIDNQKYTSKLHFFYDTTKPDTAKLTGANGKVYNLTLTGEQDLHD